MADACEDVSLHHAISVKPMFTIVAECRGFSHDVICKFAANLERQSYKNFEVVFVGVSPQRIVDINMELPRRYVIDSELRLDEFLSNGGTRLYRGSLIIFMFASDILFPQALLKIKECMSDSKETSAQVTVYDFINSKSGESCYLPGWDPDLIVYRDYISNAFCIRTETLDKLIKKNRIVDPYQLLCAVAKNNVSVLHIPETLVGLGEVSSRSKSFKIECDYSPNFSVVIPNRNGTSLLPKCVEFLQGVKGRVELVIVENRSDDPEVKPMYERIQRDFNTKILNFDRSFNYSAMINLGVANTSNEMVLLLNNDVVVSDEMSVRSALAYAARTDVGVVGSVLRYPDGKVQHAGIVLSHPTRHDFDTSHVLRFSEFSEGCHVGALTAPRNWQCVTGAFQAIRKSVFEAVGGYDEVNLPVEFNDIDFCLRVRSNGWKVICLPLSGIVHDESHTRSKIDRAKANQLSKDAYQVMKARWADCYDSDPFYNAQVRKMSAGAHQRTALRFTAALRRHFQRMMPILALSSSSDSHYVARARMPLRLQPGVCIVAPFRDSGYLGNFSRSIAAACDNARIDVSFVDLSRELATKMSMAADFFQPFCDRVTTLCVFDHRMLADSKLPLGEGRRRILILLDSPEVMSEYTLSDLRLFDEIWVPSGLNTAYLYEMLGGALRILPKPVEHLLNATEDRPLVDCTGEGASESEAVRHWLISEISDRGESGQF